MMDSRREPSRRPPATGGGPLVVGLDSPYARNPELVGDGAALLATARHRKLPVADGAVVTVAGVAAPDCMPAFRLAWRRTAGPVRLMISDRGRPSGLGTGPARCDATTWVGMLEGLSALLEHDQIENPERRTGRWALLVLKEPVAVRSLLLETGPDGRMTLWTADDEPVPVPRAEQPLRGLAELARNRLGHPLSLTVMMNEHRELRIVDLRRCDSSSPRGP